MLSDKNQYWLKAIIILFHLIGVAGVMIDPLRDFIVGLTPLHLLLMTGILLLGHKGSWQDLTSFFLLSFTIGFAVEVVGVNYGFPFGNYEYGPVLGWKIFETPIMIGINWFLLSYSFGVLTLSLNGFSVPGKALLAAAMMTALDIVIEPTAIYLNYWSWDNGSVPLLNYAGWFVVSFLIQMIFHKNISNHISNGLALTLIGAQVIFFLSIFIFQNF